MTNKKEGINRAELIEILAHKYCWTIACIKSLTTNQIKLLVKSKRRE